MYLDVFHILTVANNAATNMCVQVSVRVSVFISFEYVPRSGIGTSCNNSMFK